MKDAIKVEINKEVSDKELDEIYNAFDALMWSGCWNFLDDFIKDLVMRSWRIELDKLLAYATASFPAKSKLPHREVFINNCKLLHPEKDLWKGLD